MTLVDSLDMLLIIGEHDGFLRGVKLVLQHVSFNKSLTVQVFEVTIRVLGGLLGAHNLATEF